MTAAPMHTWDQSRLAEAQWSKAPHLGDGWIPLGFERQACGCLVDTFRTREVQGQTEPMMWRPCMAHEGEGHLSVLSEQDGMSVAVCLVGTCGWKAARYWTNDAIQAAQQHWMATAPGAEGAPSTE